MDDALSRRRFLKTAAAMGVAGAIAPSLLAEEKAAPMPMRKLGRTGLSVSLFGLGCHPLGQLKDDREKEAVAIITRAIEHGVNYLDTAPSYGRGRSERRVGAAIKGRRDKLVITTKSTERKAAGVLKEIEGSLKRLGTDRVDIFQMHSLQGMADVQERFGPGGAIEGFVKAKKEGKARFLGVTGHVDPEVMREALGRFEFDTILIPLNCVDVHFRSFIEGTLPTAVEQGIGIVAMKLFASGNLLRGDHVTAEECIRYAVNLPISTAVMGAKSEAEVDLDARVVKSRKPLPKPDATEIRKKSLPLKGKKTEWYKKA